MYKVNDTVKRILGQRLKNYRLQKGMTQEELAKKIRYTADTISRYEKGKYNLNIGMLLLFCQVLGVKPSTFIQGMEVYYCSIHQGGK
jgi:transcriptional regulator with XRE-family HTH domain